MAAVDDLKAAVKAVQDETVTTAGKVAACITRVEKVIADLTAGSVSATDVLQSTDDLNVVVSNLKSIGTTADAERPLV